MHPSNRFLAQEQLYLTPSESSIMANPNPQPGQPVTQLSATATYEPIVLSEHLSQVTTPDTMSKLEMKRRLDCVMEWLEEESSEKISTAAIIFNVNPASTRMCQYRKRHQEPNSRGTYNHHGGNNIILTEAQELAIY